MKDTPKRVSRRPIALLLLCIVFLICFLVVRYSKPELHSSIPVVTVPDSEATTTPIVPVGPVLQPSQPIGLRIPTLAIDVPFGPALALDSSGEIAVPEDYDAVGWYQYSPTPGELGPAIVLGHVDSYTGPAVFFSLGQLKPGDSIFVSRADGSSLEFVVETLERYEQQAFPSQKVYGNIDHAGLRLITCSGVYERGSARYTHNLVVYARLKDAG